MIRRHNSDLRSFITFLTLMNYFSLPIWSSSGIFGGREGARLHLKRMVVRIPALVVSNLSAEEKNRSCHLEWLFLCNCVALMSIILRPRTQITIM